MSFTGFPKVHAVKGKRTIQKKMCWLLNFLVWPPYLCRLFTTQKIKDLNPADPNIP